MSTENLHDENQVQARLLLVVAGLAEELHGDEATHVRVEPNSDFERDLGFDSLGRAELLARVEQAFSVQLPPAAFASAATPAELLRVLAGSPCAPPDAAARWQPPDAPSRESRYPEDAHTLPEALRWHAQRHPDHTHVVLLADDLSETLLSYGSLQQRATNMAGGLRAQGLDPGDTIALMLPTGADYFVTFMAALLCGAVPVPIYPPAQRSQLREHIERYVAILRNAQIKALVTFEEAAPVARILQTRVESLRHVFTPRHIPTRTLGDPIDVDTSDLALLQYTSGSTGAPKGVMLSHANLLANIRAMGERMDVRATDVLVSWLPLYHDMGLIGAWLAPLYFGLPLIIVSPLVFLARPRRWLEIIARYRGTLTAAPNFAYEQCARHLADDELRGLDLSTMRLAFCGAEPVSAATMRAFATRMAPYGFEERALTPVYGLAENTLGLTFPTPGQGLRTDRIARDSLDKLGEAAPCTGLDAIEVPCCGYPLTGTHLRIVDDKERELGERKVGRIEFRGTSATCGYYRNAEQSARLCRDGWLDTGDLGYLADGELYVTGRVKDVIIRGGRHFFPYELESAIARLPGIAPEGVAVCGAKDPASGTESIMIFAETAETDPTARATLARQINDTTIARFGEPAEQVYLVAPHSILKTPGGKIRHAATLEQFLAHGKRLPRAPAVWRQLLGVAAGSLPALGRRVAHRFQYAARGVYCWTLLALFAPPTWLAVVIGHDVERSWRVTARACRALLRLFGLHVELVGDIAALSAQPLIAAANHASYLDNLVLLATLPHPIAIIAKRELATQPFVGRFLRAIGTRFVERRDYRGSLADEAALVELAAERQSLLFFPEGTFTRAAGLAPFRLGAFRAACMANLPVVPIALHGTRSAMRDGEWIPRKGAITVTVSAPIRPDGSDFAAMTRLRDRVRSEILAHCGEPGQGALNAALRKPPNIEAPR